MEEEKHIIAILVENELYNKIRSLDEDDKLDFNKKEKSKQELIEIFIVECMKRSKVMTEEQVREHVNFVLNRTINNMKDIER